MLAPRRAPSTGVASTGIQASVGLAVKTWCTSSSGLSTRLIGMATATRRTNRRVVYDMLRRKVLTLELPPGTALSENELAAALGVSRTPVRESLILLADEGLVQVFPQVGHLRLPGRPGPRADAQFLREAVELAALDDVPAELGPRVVAELRANLDDSAARNRPGGVLRPRRGVPHGLLRLSGHGGRGRRSSSAKGHLDRARRLGAQGDLTGVVRRPARRDFPGGRRRRPRPGRAQPCARTFGRCSRTSNASGALARAVRVEHGSVPVRRNVVAWE